MTKQDLQKELKEKVKEGVKPSDLRKLKRSKSAGDIPKAPLPKSTPLVKSKSAQELEPTSSKIEELETKISVLELKLEVSQREIKGLEADNYGYQQQLNEKALEHQADKQLFQDQLKQKQQELENLREQLE